MQETDSKELSNPGARARRWSFGSAQFDEARQLLTLAGSPITVEPKPLQLLSMLLEQAGEVLTKRELIEALWPGRVVTDGVLTNAVNKLRAALNDDPPQIVRTVHGHGYKLGVPAAVEWLTAEPPPNLRLGPGQAPPQRPLWGLVQRLGRGGQGEAWLAEHSKTRERRVFKFALDESALTSLKREVTLYRLLSQTAGISPTLVRVLDWNFTDRPYFIESEWQPQGNLLDWAQARGGIGSLPLAQRLELVAELAQTLAQAHDVGVLHRDLKPSNLFVAQEGEVIRLRMADWGAGEVTQSALLTQAGITRAGFTRMGRSDSSGGTPAYQPPEMLSGQPATARGDIYALGVLLYQMVVADLRRPLAPGWEQDVDDPLLREDIALAAHGKPEQRLGDATELARRLRTLDARHAARETREQQEQALAGQAQEQRAVLERARGRRTAMQVSLALALVALIVIAGLYLRAEQARERSARDVQTAQAVTRFLTEDLLASANPLRRGRRDLSVREALDSASRNLAQRIRDPEVLAATRLAIGSAYAGIGDRQLAEQNLQAALTHWEQTGAGDAPAAQGARTALAELYAAARDLESLTRMAQTLLAVEARTATPDAALALRAQLALDYAHCYRPGFTLPDCVARMRELHARALDTLGSAHPDAARIGLSLAGELARGGQPDEGLALAQSAMDDWRRAVGADDPLLLSRSQDYGLILLRVGRAQEAAAHFHDLRARVARIYGQDHAEVQLIETNLTQALNRIGQHTEALALATRLYPVRLEAFGEDDLYSRFIRGEHAYALFKLGRVREAQGMLRALVSLDERVDGPDRGQTPRHRQWLEEIEAAVLVSPPPAGGAGGGVDAR